MKPTVSIGQTWQEKFGTLRKLDVLVVLTSSVLVRYHNTDKEVWVPLDNFRTAYAQIN